MNSDLINIRIAEIQKDHSWEELWTNLKLGTVVVPIFLLFLGFIVGLVSKPVEQNIGGYTIFLNYYMLFMSILIIGILLLAIYFEKKRIDIRNRKNNLRFLILKHYSVSGNLTLEKYILDDKMDVNKEEIEAIINSQQRKPQRRKSK